MPVFDFKPMLHFNELKALKATEGLAIPIEWLSFGVAFGIGIIFLVGLWFGHSTLKRSVWVSQLLFVVVALLSLTWMFFAAGAYPKGYGPLFALLLRLQLILNTIAAFNLVHANRGKQSFGFVYSGFLGALFGLSLLNLIWPVESILYISDIFLIITSLYLGARVLIPIGRGKSWEMTLFFQSMTGGLMSFTYFWIPEGEALHVTSVFIFGLLTTAMLLSSSATTLCSAKERTYLLLDRLQKDLFETERRLAKQSQLAAALKFDNQSLGEQLQNETLRHRQDSIGDHLRIRSLEESSQDIAHGILTQLSELQSDSLFIISEAKSPTMRLSSIKAHAERSHFLVQRIQNLAGFLLSTEAALDMPSDKDAVVSAGEILKECLYLCNRKIKRMGIEVEFQSLDNDLWVRGKPALLAQGFLGLIYNALEATEAAAVRRVTLVLRRIEADDQLWVEFGISNSGPGIPTVIKARAFHEKQRDGLGFHSLGLSMAFGIFEHAGGSLNLDTDAVATTLLARLPLAQKTRESSLKLVI